MQSWKLWLSLLAALTGCTGKNGGLPAAKPGSDAAADGRAATEDTPAVTMGMGGGTGGTSAAGGTMASGGVLGTGGAPGSGGTGAFDASLAEADARASAGGGSGETGTGGGSGGTGGSRTTSAIGGALGGDMGSGGIGSGGIGGLDGGLGTGGKPTSILQVVPRNNDIPGWTIDPNSPATAGQIAAVATTRSESEAMIDGAAEAFFVGPATPKTFAWQNYVSPLPPRAGIGDGSALMLFILELPSAEQAASLYLSLMQSSPYASGYVWTEPTSPLIGVRSRIADTGSDWWICFCKGSYYVEVRMTPSYGPAPDYAPSDPAQKKAAMDFAIAVAARI